MREWIRQVGVELRSGFTTTAGALRTTGICWGGLASALSRCRGWRARKTIFFGSITTHRRYVIRGTRRRSILIIRYERSCDGQNAAPQWRGEGSAERAVYGQRFPV